MIGRAIAMAVALFSGVLASQAPEFSQQYRQRLGGAVDELSRVVADFDHDTAIAGLDRQAGIARMTKSTDTLVHLRGVSMGAAVARYERLRDQLLSFERSNVVGRIESIVKSPDPAITKATFDAFVPAVPTTPAGAVTALAGFVAGYLLIGAFRLVVLPLRRQRRRRRRREREEDALYS